MFGHPFHHLHDQFVRPGLWDLWSQDLRQGRAIALVLGDRPDLGQRHDAGHPAVADHHHVVALLRHHPVLGKALHRNVRAGVGARAVENRAHLDVLKRPAEVGERHRLRQHGGARQAGALDREADYRRHEQDVAEHDEHEQREYVLPDHPQLEQNQEQRDFRNPFRHQAGGERERRLDAGQVGAEERTHEFACQRNHRQRHDRAQRNGGEGEIELQAGRGEEQRHEQTLRRTAHPRHDLPVDALRQPGQRNAEQQRPEGAVQTDLLGSDHDQEQPAEQQAERQLGYVHEALQEQNRRRQHPRRQHPGHDHETGDLQEQRDQPQHARLMVFANGEAYYQQCGHLGDGHDGEDFQPDRFFQMAGVGQHLGHQPEARQRQDAGQRQRFVEVEAESEREPCEVGGDQHGGHQRNDHRQHGGHEVAPANGRHEALNIDLVETDQKEQHEDAEPQEQLNLRRRKHDAEHGPEDDAGGGVGDDRAQAEAPEDALDELGDDDEKTEWEQYIQQHVIGALSVYRFW